MWLDSYVSNLSKLHSINAECISCTRFPAFTKIIDSNNTWSGPVFCLLLGVSSDYAQPITGQVTEVTCPVIGRAQHELTLSKRQKTGPDDELFVTWITLFNHVINIISDMVCYYVKCKCRSYYYSTSPTYFAYLTKLKDIFYRGMHRGQIYVWTYHSNVGDRCKKMFRFRAVSQSKCQSSSAKTFKMYDLSVAPFANMV